MVIDIIANNSENREIANNFIKTLPKELVDKLCKVEIDKQKRLIFTGYLDYQSSSVEIPYSDVVDIRNIERNDGYRQICVHVVMNKIDIFYNFILIKTDGFDIEFKKVLEF